MTEGKSAFIASRSGQGGSATKRADVALSGDDDVAPRYELGMLSDASCARDMLDPPPRVRIAEPLMARVALKLADARAARARKR